MVKVLVMMRIDISTALKESPVVERWTVLMLQVCTFVFTGATALLVSQQIQQPHEENRGHH